MKIDGLSCDKCNKPWYSDPMRVGRLPEGWFALTKGSNGLIQQDKHFCCIECLIKWTSLQTVDSRKFDVEGPVNSLALQSEVKIVRAEVKEKIEHDVYPDPSAMTKTETILQWIDRARSEAQLGSPVTRLSVLVDDIEELCREEKQMPVVGDVSKTEYANRSGPGPLVSLDEVNLMPAPTTIVHDEYWREL